MMRRPPSFTLERSSAASDVYKRQRLLRFGTELIYYIAHYMGTRVVILDEPEQESFETELVKDVITLMTVFCARLYGKRS